MCEILEQIAQMKPYRICLFENCCNCYQEKNRYTLMGTSVLWCR